MVVLIISAFVCTHQSELSLRSVRLSHARPTMNKFHFLSVLLEIMRMNVSTWIANLMLMTSIQDHGHLNWPNVFQSNSMRFLWKKKVSKNSR